MSLELSPGLNHFIGANGAGKTAILEAVHLLARGRSFRTPSTTPILRTGAEELMVRGEVQGQRFVHQIALAKDKAGTTRLKIDGESHNKLSRAAEKLPVQLMLPGVGDLVFGPPSLRRQFLDWGLFHVEHGFLDLIRGYQRVLRQRNAWLRQVAEMGTHSPDPWIESLVPLGRQIHDARLRYVEGLVPKTQWALKQLGLAGVELRYYAGWRLKDHPQFDAELLSQALEGEVKSPPSQAGPHRADLRIVADGHPASGRFSRGQGKLAASALLLAQTALQLEKSGDSGVFLIDDIGAELDGEKSERFYDALETMNCQVLATSTQKPSRLGTFSGLQPSLFHVEQGEVRLAN